MRPFPTPPTIPVSVDPRREPDAYISHGGHLYEVIEDEQTGPNSGRLRVRNCLTLHPLKLTVAEVDESDLVKAAPQFEVPDRLPA
jgi:hypothetical protein